MGITPSQPASAPIETAAPAAPAATMEAALHDRFWQESEAAACGLTREEFSEILAVIGSARNYGQPTGSTPSPAQQAAFFRSLKLADLALARACAQGKETAWERFLVLYQQPLRRAAIAIAGSETQGRDLADALYAELFGLGVRDGQRRCPLDSYQGRGSLLGWLRTTLAQRHVDHHRRTWREQPLETPSGEIDPPAADPEPQPNPAQLDALAQAVADALSRQPPEDRFLLASYYLDGRTLLEIARILRVHEATVSRKLRRVTDGLRKQVLHNLQHRGLSKRAAQEALGADPRDLTDLNLNLKKLLQIPLSDTFPEKAVL